MLLCQQMSGKNNKELNGKRIIELASCFIKGLEAVYRIKHAHNNV